MAEACEALGTPVVSGNVSLYNETEAGAVYPTPVVGMVGLFQDVRRHATPGFKREGDMIVVIGSGPDVSLAGTEYLEIIHGRVAGKPPEPDLAAERKTADLVRNMIRSGLVDTAHDVSDGGELVALAEMALAGGLGIECEEDELERRIAGQGRGRADVLFFGEGSGDFVVAVSPDRWDELQAVLAEAPGYDQIGTVGGDRFKIGEFVDVSLADLREAYERDLFGAPGGAEVTH